MGVVLVNRPPTEGELFVQRRREFRSWLERHVQVYKEWEKDEGNRCKKGNQSVPHYLVVVLEPDHPRYMQMGQWRMNDRESGEWYVEYVDGCHESLGGYGGHGAGGVSRDKLELVYVPILTVADGAFLEWVQPGIRSLLAKILEELRR